MTEEPFVQKTSLFQTLRLALIAIAVLLLLELAGFYVSSRSFLSDISAIQEIQGLSNVVGELRQITDSLGNSLHRAEADPSARTENLKTYLGIYNEALTTLLSATARANGDEEYASALERARVSLLELNQAATRFFAETDSRDRARDLLIADQFISDTGESFDKLELAFRRRADSAFQEAYRQRYRPLVASTVLAAIFMIISVVAGLHLIRRLQAAVESLIRATQEAARGNMEVMAPILTRDEIGALANSFNEMAAALRNRDEFLSIASHELKTPITSLVLSLEVFMRELRKGSDPRKLEAIASNSAREGHRLAQLLDGLLDLTQIRRGQLRLEKKQLNLSELTKSVAERFALETREKGILLSVRTEESVIGYWDPVRIDQVLSNLISNAIKYGNGKPITVAVENDPLLQRAHVIVQDRGIGIPAEMLDKVFERYRRVDDVAVRRLSGVGLGLYVSRQIVRSHGGTIRVESKVGAGSTFVVELPWRSEDLVDLQATA